MGFSSSSGGRRRRRSTVQPSAQINLTSLLDITFVLLIAFMIVAPTITHSLDIELPKATPPEEALPPPEPETVKNLTLGYGGLPEGPHLLDLDGENVEDFAALEREARQWKKEQKVAIRVDRRVPSGMLLGAAVALQRAGVAGYHFVYQDE